MSKKRKLALAAAVCAALLLTGTALAGYLSAGRGTPLPVLMYHHFADTANEDTVVSAERFREQIAALKNAGYASVTLGQIRDFVENGAPLPDRPVLITMDDGYTSNLEIAAPVLEDYGMNAVVFVIGINEGETYYVHSGNPLWPARFSYEEAAPWMDKGVLDLQSHTMDMHQLESYGYSGRDGMLPLAGESSKDWQNAVKADAALFRERRNGRVSTELTALAYPFGYCTEELDRLMADEGFVFTLTIDEHCNRLNTGDENALRMMGRYNVTDRMSGPELVGLLNRARR